MKVIEYFLIPQSPWAYLGHERLRQIAASHGATIEPKPFLLGERVFPQSGGLPLAQRPVQRQAYRLLELQRWSRFLAVPLNIHPAFFPVDGTQALQMIALVVERHGSHAALDLSGRYLKAVWADELNIADPQVLVQLAEACGLNGETLYADREQAVALLERNTQQAIDRQVFGAPWYFYRNEPFWGQDRLDFLERALAET